MNTPILEVSDIQKYYGSRDAVTKALDRISFSVEGGEFVGIMGASGSGKTTLLNCISTVDTVTSGKIFVEGEDISALRGKQLSAFRREKLGFIFQDFNLLDTLTAYENISLAISIRASASESGKPFVRGHIFRKKAKEIDGTVRELAEALNITEIMEKYPYQMSGGQRQRVAAARAIVTNPALILADEPTGALDSRSAHKLLDMLGELNQRFLATILMVTHDAFTASYCRRILFLQDGKIFNEIRRGGKSRKQFFEEIMEVISVLGGETRGRN